MFLQNQILSDTYQVLKPIGNGGTSSVYLAYHLRLRKYVVIKQLRGTFSDDFLLRTEVDILKNLHHPYLPQVYDFVQDKNNVYTIIDYVDGHDLESYIRGGTKLPEQLLKHYLRQIAEVLEYLHGQNPSVIHSDIKPGNIIIDQNGNAVLIDFNTSIGGNQGNLLGLTLPYASPEQIQLAQYVSCGMQAPFDLDNRTDIYSLGATFYELICGIRPTPGIQPAPLHSMGLSDYSYDFLVLIDRMIEYDREKRLKSAKKLVAAIDRLDSRYWTFFVLRCASLLVSAALVGSGFFCLIRGINQVVAEAYQASYSNTVGFVQLGCLEQAEMSCQEILSSKDMMRYLNDEPDELARLYHALGDIRYFRQEYASAAQYYSYAVNISNNNSDLAVFLRDAALAWAQSGDISKAQQYLDQAKRLQISGDELNLIAAVLSLRSGNYDTCIQYTNMILQSSSNAEVCLRAALTAASGSSNLSDRIYWLEIARKYDPGKTALRGLALAYGEIAQSTSNQAELLSALQNAKDLYAQLCDSIYVSSTDMINYSVILRMTNQERESLTVLQRALEYDPYNYRVMAHICFVQYELGETSQAQTWCDKAIRAWRADNSSNKLSENSEEIQNLLELARRFGIGG